MDGFSLFNMDLLCRFRELEVGFVKEVVANWLVNEDISCGTGNVGPDAIEVEGNWPSRVVDG